MRIGLLIAVPTLILAGCAQDQPTSPGNKPARAEPRRLRAFPGAQGFGAYVTGGRGYPVYHVTTLADSGPGSFRDAVSQGNRIIVFDVAGYIDLQSPITISVSNLTIAGQTAPGMGLAIRNYQVLFKHADNVIVRFLRFRHGTAGTGHGDSLSVTQSSNLIVDHISSAWGRDENFSVTKSRNVTVQYCIIAEGLLRHSMGGLIEWNTISLHHNLYISNNERNPKAKGRIDFVNNVIYNWGRDAFIAGDSAGLSYANVVANVFIAGPASTRLDDPISRGNVNFHLYLRDNLFDADRNGRFDPVRLEQNMVDDPVTWASEPFDYPPLTVQPPQQAYETVLARAGDCLVRDAIDQRLIEYVRTQAGQLVSDPAEVGGFPELIAAPAPPDADRDGLPDDWERRHHLDPHNPADAAELAPDGYSYLEHYLNHLAATGRPNAPLSAARSRS